MTSNTIENKTAFSSYTSDQAILILETALTEISQRIWQDRANQSSDSPSIAFKRLDLEKIMTSSPPSKADMFVGLFEDHPIEGALKLSMRNIGEMLYEIGGNDLLASVSERVSNKPLKCHGHTGIGSDFDRQMNLIAHSWNGIGNWYA